jgi:peptide/nickel transport system substrate-binding protein
MLGKKTLRLITAALLVGVALGAQHVSGATARHTGAAPVHANSGVVAITDWQFPDGCGPGAASVANQEVCAATWDSLFGLDNHLNYFPDLATNIPTFANGGAKTVGGNLVVTYVLKPNLRWSDGAPQTTRDLVFGTNLNLAIGNSFGIDQIKSMQVLDSRRLRVTYKGQYAPYYEFGAPIPLPQAYMQKKYGTSNIRAMASKFTNDVYNSPRDVFNGPFKIGSWTTGQSIVLVPNPYYNALPPASGHPRLAQIKFVNIASEEAALVAALGSPHAGVDKAEDFQVNDLPALNHTRYHISVTPELTVEHLELNQAGPLKDVRLRQALQYAIDKIALYKALFPNDAGDASKFVLRSILPNNSAWRDPSIGISPYNPAKARALMRAAGYSDQYSGSGRHLVLHFYTTRALIRQKDFQILSRYWAAVGVHVLPTFTSGDPSANGGMFSPYNLNGVLAHRNYDIALFAFTEYPDAAGEETSFDPSLIPTAAPNHHSAADQNYNGITDADQWSLLVAARHTFDSGKRHALYNQWQRLVNQRVYMIMLYARQDITADDGKIGNFKPNGSAVGNDWNAFEWYKAAS